MEKAGFKKLFSGSLGFYFIGVDLIGFFDSFYLTVKHYFNSPLNCSILAGCDKVAASAYAKIYGIPIPLLGVIFYLAFFVLFFAFSISPAEGGFKKKRMAGFMVFAAFLGVVFSAWLLFLQIFVIKALCLYCLVSDAAAAAIFALSLILLFRHKEK
ncbi:MAG: vitamin K epoxide reductase family protein [Patescibacteria group bacterium]|nr:vitamin K epoxide reductase family protein [Patescibacteria group bacterium]